MSLEDDLNRFASRGREEGPGAVYERAIQNRGPSNRYLDAVDAKRSSAVLRRAVTACLIALFVGAIALAASRGGQPATTDVASTGVTNSSEPVRSATEAPLANSVPTTESPAEVAAANKVLAEQMAAGWVPLSPKSFTAVEGDTPPPGDAWIPYDKDPTKVMDADNQRVPAYDKPNGSIVGYLYAFGWVSAETANSPTFDLEALKEKMGLCRTDDFECARRQLEERLHPAP